jgi:hypothetical protein
MTEKKYITPWEYVAELEKLGISIGVDTVRRWCRTNNFGIQLSPGGDYFIPTSKLAALADKASAAS